jgi:hypothetical protein
MNDGLIKHVEDIDVVLEGLDETNISSILKKWNEINSIKKKLEQLDEMLKIKVKNYLKERHWLTFKDTDTKINVSLITQKNETFDKAQLKLILSDSQYSQVIKTTTFEKLLIVNPETRERMKKFTKDK